MEETWGNGHYSCYGCKHESSKDAFSCKRCLTYTPLMKPYYQNWTKNDADEKEESFTDHLLNMGYTKGMKDGYAKAIEEFKEAVKNRAHSTERNDWSADYMISIWESVIDEIAEQLKGE